MTITEELWASLQSEPMPGDAGHFSRLLAGGHPGVVRFRWRLPEKIRGVEFEVPASAIPATLRFPSAAGFRTSVSSARRDVGVHSTILLEACESRYNDIFASITDDLLSLRAPASNADGIAHLALRLEAWAAFFRNGGGAPSESAQLGLIAELWIIRDYLIPQWGAELAVDSWTGPMGRPQDFQGHAAIEVKATAGPLSGKVSISGARQLDDSLTGRPLFLAVCFAERVANDGESIQDVLRSLSMVLAPDLFDILLGGVIASGLDPSSANAKNALVFKQRSWKFYAVSAGFPRLVASDLTTGVLAVSYDISLPACEPFSVPASNVTEQLRNQE